MKALLMPSTKTKMSRFHGKHSWSFPVIYIVLFYLNIHICSSSDEESWPPPRCNMSDIPEVSKYVSNLNASLNILHVNAAKGRFNSSEYGQSPDQVYALLQCRGDATVDECYNCTQQAKIDVLQTCESKIGSRVQKKFCFLRFENYNFTGELDTMVENLRNEDRVSSDPDVFLAAARQLLSNLSSYILSGSAPNRFASRSIIDSSRRPIFALAQCWGDISLDDCKQCLSIAIDSLCTDHSGRLGARALAGSCFVQYESKLSSDKQSWPPPICNTSNNSEGSKYVSNVNTALNILRVDASQKRFNSCEYGQSPDQVYALLQCRGDATVQECYNCSQQAKIDVLQTCWTNIGSRVHEKFCFLRFENHNFIGELDIFVVTLTNEESVSSDPDLFLAAVQQLLSNLSSDILSGSAANRFASRSIIDSSRRPIFALAQCWGDISLYDCKQCLSIAIDRLFTNNYGRLGARALAGSCILQYESKLSSNRAPPPQPQEKSTGKMPQEKSTSKIPLILGVLGGLLLPLIVCSFAIRKRLKNGVFGRPNDGHFMGNDSQIEEGEQPNSKGQVLGRIPSLFNDFTFFKMETLVAATENFHDNNKLGEGGFGTVYRGTSPEGDEIAVKKLSLHSAQGKEEFLNEVKLVAKVQHRNLVKLLGCCAEGSEKLLVYEYLPNNSLDKILFDPNKRRQLDWQKRYSIILGVTRGLLYLHEDSHLRIIHRDIKAGNILLDGKLKPKIADFGLARLFDEDETHVRTRIAGTRGYMAPEYAMNGQLSVKVDVYSFGILLLEIMSGRKNTDFNLPLETQILLQWAWGLYKGGNIVDMIDPVIIETCSGQEEEQALRCIHVGWLCTQARSSLRPSMCTVNLMLSSEAMVLPEPTEPAFVSSVRTNSTDNSVSSQTPRAPSSIAEASITELEPR